MQDNEKRVLFTHEEINNLKIFDTLDKLKERRNLLFVMSFINTFLFFLATYNIVKLIKLVQLAFNRPLVTLVGCLFLGTFLILMFATISFYIKRFLEFSKLYDKCISLDDLPFVYICKSKIDKCKKLIENNQNTFELDYWYSEFKVFVDNNYAYIFTNDNIALHEEIDELDLLYEKVKSS